jgi:hypothetical protein
MTIENIIADCSKMIHGMASESVLPMLLIDENNNVVEEIICISISGGADYDGGMPRCLSLMRFKHGKRVGWAEYKLTGHCAEGDVVCRTDDERQGCRL